MKKKRSLQTTPTQATPGGIRKRVRRKPKRIFLSTDFVGNPRSIQLRPSTSYSWVASMIAKSQRKCVILFLPMKAKLGTLKRIFQGMAREWVTSIQVEGIAVFSFDSKQQMTAFSRDLSKRADQEGVIGKVRWWCVNHNGEFIYGG
jgi:hypothetical protein